MSRPVTPAADRPVSVLEKHVPGVAHAGHAGAVPHETTYLSGGLHDDNDSVQDIDGSPGLQRSNSQMSQSATYVPSRGGTLKKKAVLQKSGSLKRSGSKKSTYAGSVRSLKPGDKERYEPEEYNSAFYCPVPTVGSPTELLANRFQAWRKVLKDLITYFKDLHKSYETRSKTLLSASNVINNTTMPMDFLSSGGIGEAASILRDFHKQALNESHKARDLENEVIMQLTGLRSDLSQKIKEIKSLSGDFKNSVGKEQDTTRKAISSFQESLGMVDRDASGGGRGDPFIQKLAIERQIERQVEEENYLHRAYLNLEASGRELESIVIGEIQKAYNVLYGVLKREADDNVEVIDKLREGPLAMSKDHEWDAFVTDNDHMVDPRQPLRQSTQIMWPGQNSPAAIEVRNGMLERKSKYLKNYTPGWYILSPTHLHEFKSADRIASQQPIMSLYLPDQKIGSHSEGGSSSHKFMLKGRQAGSMHRGHTWIFRAESHDTMMAWYADIKELTEKTGEARNEFVRRTHARSVSQNSNRPPSISSGASQMEEDEADRVAFSSEQSVRGVPLDSRDDNGTYPAEAAGTGAVIGTAAVIADDRRSEVGWRPPQQRPQPGGRFPSDVNVTRGLQAPLSPSSGDSGDDQDRDALAQAGALPGSAVPFVGNTVTSEPSHPSYQQPMPVEQSKNETAGAATMPPTTTYTAGEHPNVVPQATGAQVAYDTQSQHREWEDTMAAGVGGAALGAGATAAHHKHKHHHHVENSEDQMAKDNAAIPSHGYSSAPIMAATAAPINAPTEPKAMRYEHDSTIEPQPVRSENNAPAEPKAMRSQYDTTLAAPSNDAWNTSQTVGSSVYNDAIAASAVTPVSPQARSSLNNNDKAVAPTNTTTRTRALSSSVYNAATLPHPVEQPQPNNEAFVRDTGKRTPSSISTTRDVSQPGPITDTTFNTLTDLSSPTRPVPMSAKSVQTISDLHIPGEFPRTDSKGVVRDSSMYK